MWLGQLERCSYTVLNIRCRQGKRGTSFGITKIWREDLGSHIKITVINGWRRDRRQEKQLMVTASP